MLVQASPTQILLELSTSLLRDLLAGSPPQALAEHLCATLAELCPGHGACMLQFDEDGTVSLYASAGLEVNCADTLQRVRPALLGDDEARAAGEFAWLRPIRHEQALVGAFGLQPQSAPAECAAPCPAATAAADFGVTIAATLLGFERMARRQRESARAAQRLAALNTFIMQVNKAIAAATDEAALLQQICDLAIRHGGLVLAYIARPDAEGRFQYPAAAGRTEYLDGIVISTDPDQPEGQGSAGRAWREGTAYFNQSFHATPMLEPWRERALSLGLRASAVLPLRRDGGMWALLLVYRDDDAGFDDALQAVLLDLARDVSRGLEQVAARRVQHALLGNALVGFALLRDRSFVDINVRGAELCGETREAMLGRPTSDFLDPATHARTGALYDQMAEGRVGRLEAIALRRADGRTMLCDLAAVSLPEGGLTIVTLEDVTQRELQARRLERLAALNALLADVNRASASARSMEGLFEAACRAVAMRMAVAWVWIGRVDGRAFQDVALIGPGPLHDPRGARQTTQTWRSGQPGYLDEPQGALTALPINDGSGVVAVMALRYRQLQTIDAEARERLEELAAALSHGLTLLAQRHRIDNLQRLYRALVTQGDVLLQASDEEELLRRTCSDLVRDTPFHAAWVARPEGEASMLAAAGSDLPTPGSAEPGWRLMLRAWRSDTLVVEAGAGVHGAVLAVPVRRGGARWAVLVFQSHEPRAFDDETAGLCRRLASLLGRGLDELDVKARFLALQDGQGTTTPRDPLTGLPNRVALELYLEQALARARRHRRAVAVGLLHVDDLRRINDTHGRDTGDRLLRELAQRLSGAMRATDYVAREGGDKFMLAFDDVDEASALQQLSVVLQRLQQVIEVPFELASGTSLRLETTLGLVLFPRDGDTPDALLRLADAVMYQTRQRKPDRQQWWSLGLPGPAPVESEDTFDSYGARAAAALGKASSELDALARDFTREFFDDVERNPEAGRPLRALDGGDIDWLKNAQIEHMQFLMHPRTTEKELIARSRQVGRVHALLGVSVPWMAQRLARYRGMLVELLGRLQLPARERYHLMLAAEARLQCDMQAQIEGRQEVIDTYMSMLSTPPPKAETGVALLRIEVERLAALPGIAEALLSSPDAADDQASFHIRAGALGATPTPPLLRPPMRTVHADGDAHPSGLVEVIPPGDALRALGVRSAIALTFPTDGRRPPWTLRLLGRHPCQFDSGWMEPFASGLRRRWATLWPQNPLIRA